MNVYIVFDDCPLDFGEPRIDKVFISRKLAEKYKGEKLGKDPYKNQYLVVLSWKVNME